MQNQLVTGLFLTLSTIFLSFSSPSATDVRPVNNDSLVSATAPAEATSAYASLYQQLSLEKEGLSKDAFDYAVKGYQKLVDEGAVTNSQYLTIVDLSQSSRKKRFYLLDLQNNQLVLNTFVSHGRNSGIDEAKYFSNDFNSNQSSLGFYVTRTPYQGKHGLSLRLSGMEKGFNDNAEARGVVVHGAPYVNASRVNSAYMGRSQGCPALPETEYAKVINLIKDGSVLFIFNPNTDYLQSSELING